MAKTIQSMGLKRYLNEVYAVQGGYERFVRLLEAGWPKEQIAREFSVSRQTINHWTRQQEPSDVSR